MQRRGRATYFIDERLATRLDLVQVRRAKRKICCSWENKIGNFEVAHRPIIRCGECVNFFGDAQRCFAGFIIWSNIAHDCWINSVAENNDHIISNFRTISSAGESTWNNDVWIGRADQKAESLQGRDLIAQLRDRRPQLALSLWRDCSLPIFILCAL